MSSTDAEVKEFDPYTTGSDKKYLSGVKIALGWDSQTECPAALGDDDVKMYMGDWSVNTKHKLLASQILHRSQSTRLCVYYSDKPERQITSISHKNPVLAGSTPADIKAWYNDSSDGANGCDNGWSTYLYSAPKKYDAAGAKAPIHSAFVRENACPTWAPKIAAAADLNKSCKGGTYFVCAQPEKKVLDCCLGSASGGGCRDDQFPQSGFCDTYISDYCKKNPKSANCKCLTPLTESENKLGIATGKECFYAPCIDNLANPSASKRTYLTNAQYKARTNNACPSQIVVDCTSIGNTTVVSGSLNFVDSNNQKCGVETSGDGIAKVITKSEGNTQTTAPGSNISGLGANKKLIVIGGAVMFFMFFMVTMILLMSG